MKQLKNNTFDHKIYKFINQFTWKSNKKKKNKKHIYIYTNIYEQKKENLKTLIFSIKKIKLKYKINKIKE